ncbi:uncharacterized protein Anr2p [Trichomonascus vanleenenianus]|uniref:Anr2p n=1 Tax=Trichomonascus vanleenenianus TaxID=2268995 RepID=UPI003ECA1576
MPNRNIQVPPRVLSIFLAKFDVRKGNTIVWSKSKPGTDIVRSGVEFRAIPSGIHASPSDVIHFVQPSGHSSSVLSGVAVFKQNMDDLHHGVDRSQLEMYALGVICGGIERDNEDEDQGEASNGAEQTEISQLLQLSTFSTTKAWVYVSALDSLLSNFMENLIFTTNGSSRRFDKFEAFFDSYSVDFETRPVVEISTKVHPILSLRSLLSTYGALLFEMYKIALLRTRLLVLNPGVSIEQACNFVFCLDVLAMIPTDIASTIARRHRARSYKCNPLFNVTLADMDWLRKNQNYSQDYIATTRDSVLIEKKGLYDFSVVTDKSGRSFLQTSSLSRIYPTGRSIRRFRVLMESLDLQDEIDRRRRNYRYANALGDRVGGVCDKFISSCGSNGSIVNGFLWWASAGAQVTEETQLNCEGLPLLYPQNDEDANDSDNALEGSPEIVTVGYFHEITRCLFRTIDGIVSSRSFGDSQDDEPIEFQPSDMIEMGLDPNAESDRDFLVALVNLWWERDAVVSRSWAIPCCC